MGSVEESRISLLVVEKLNRNEEVGQNTSTLKQQAGGWKASSLILFTELCLCIAIFGITKNLVVYLKTELLEDNVTAATQVATWVGTCFLTTLIGAYVSDSYWHSPFFTFMSLCMISLGSGSIKPCLSGFGADQFDNTDTRAKSSFFSWYYLSIKIAAFISSTVIVCLPIGFSIPTILAGIAFLSFMAGSGYYRQKENQQLSKKMKNWNIPPDSVFLTKRAIVTTSDFSISGALNPWSPRYIISSAAIVEAKWLQIARNEGLTHENVAVPMNVFWQIPQYVLIGVGEVFNEVGMLEFFYDQALECCIFVK
ncbi:hypothetical protein FCM35_KLT15925 [Carex littledalei]|uniref:Uncharacterized protein n=1 Tax=Carex littledalei TaxID=544730 RepID=A0A833W1J8_9POAL|nr:hypothetical protein FCM35_KLT15925 [Carex littledalei]